jgi:MINDY deubiquitinase
MSFNPKFTSIAFDQKAGEVALFTTLGIPLVHGWLVDPASHEEYAAVSRVVSYQSARDLISHVEHLSGSSGVGANAHHAGLMDEIKENFRNGQYLLALPGHYADATLKLSQSRSS